LYEEVISQNIDENRFDLFQVMSDIVNKGCPYEDNIINIETLKTYTNLRSIQRFSSHFPNVTFAIGKLVG